MIDFFCSFVKRRNPFLSIIETILTNFAEPKQSVLRLKLLKDYDYKEIENELGIKYTNLKTIYSRALKELRMMLLKYK